MPGLMARRKARRARRRSPQKFSVLGAIESYAYASILTEGLFDATPVEFITGGVSSNLGFPAGTSPDTVQSYFLQNPQAGADYGANPLTLRELLADPGFAVNAIIGRGRANALNMVFASAAVNVSMRMFKRLLRRPLSNIQRNLVKPAFGNTVRLA